MIVEARFKLDPALTEALRNRPARWGFGALSEAVYHRTYSRTFDNRQETWADTVVRVVEGVMSIRQDWMTNVVGKRWHGRPAQRLAAELAEAIFDMRFLPPGRGLWAMGTEYVYERGSHALNNCAFVEVEGSLAGAARWLMDSLMCGVGVGFGTASARLRRRRPSGEARAYTVPDTKEGWAESVKRLVQSYERGGRPVLFDYSLIRPAGAPIRGFGGVSAGSEPLLKLHDRLHGYLEDWVERRTSQTRFIVDVMNAIGACVVSGNVRRSAELAVGTIEDLEFLDLKNYTRYPERRDIGWMSNNSVVLRDRADFVQLPELAERVRDNGEPGILNLVNVRKYGRAGERSPDAATGVNPCAEIPLESWELCNLVEVFPTRCRSDNGELTRTLELATFYASTVSLLRSHSERTNEVVARNRRIGVSVSGIADWLDASSVSHVFDTLNRGYDVVRATNARLAREAGVPTSVRVTTVKPSGTVSLLAGVSSGMHFPIGGHVVRRMRVAADSPVASLLAEAGVPSEADVVSDRTTVFEFPLAYGRGRTRSVQQVSVYEQAAVVAMLQKCWADNAVSNTLTVQPRELDQVERVLALFAPQVKSLSLLPDREGVYAQLPLERITRAEYAERTTALRPVRWEALAGSDGDAGDSKFCANDVCDLPQKEVT